LIEPRVRALVPRVVHNLANQHSDLFKNARLQTGPQPAHKPAQPAPEKPRSMAEAMSKGMSMSEILKTTQSELEQADADNVLGLDEARQMSDRDILATPRRADL